MACRSQDDAPTLTLFPVYQVEHSLVIGEYGDIQWCLHGQLAFQIGLSTSEPAEWGKCSKGLSLEKGQA
ncbi:hypothetical protein D3C81_2133510 [compost metagenome]